MTHPIFLSIDGGDGTGKSTQVELLARWLRQQGRDLVTCRDPGSTSLGEAVRNILLCLIDIMLEIAVVPAVADLLGRNIHNLCRRNLGYRRPWC